MEGIDRYFAPSPRIIQEALGVKPYSGIVSNREKTRTVLDKDIVLTIPVVGGSSTLKRRDLDYNSVLISAHDDWQRRHLGAWNAVYGKTPYFIHIFPELEKIYNEFSYGKLIDFNRKINDLAFSLMDFENLKDYVEKAYGFELDKTRRLREDIEHHVKMDKTVYDALFRYGREVGILFMNL